MACILPFPDPALAGRESLVFWGVSEKKKRDEKIECCILCLLISHHSSVVFLFKGSRKEQTREIKAFPVEEL